MLQHASDSFPAIVTAAPTTTPVDSNNSNNNLPRIFEHQQFGNLRVIMDEKTGEPWFVAKDVAEALGYERPNDAVTTHCKHAKILKHGDSPYLNIPNRGCFIIPQGDVYRLVARSKLPTAQKIEEWIFDEVVPSVVKHGLYATPTTIEAMIADPSFAIRLLTNIQEERQARMAAELAHKEAQAKLTTTRSKLAETNTKLASASTKLASAAPKAALVDAAFAKTASPFGKAKLFKLQDVARKLHGVNVMAIHRDLNRLKVFYKPKKTGYRVYAKYRDSHFVEKWDDYTGKMGIFATVKGAALIADFHRQGLLTKRGERS